MRTVIIQTANLVLLVVTVLLMVLRLTQHEQVVNTHTTVTCYAPVVCHWDEAQHAVIARVEEPEYG